MRTRRSGRHEFPVDEFRRGAHGDTIDPRKDASLARRSLEHAAPAKFAIGLIIMGLGFIVMIPAARIVAEGQQVSPTWLFFTYLLHTMGELALSPVGLSSITKLAPKRFVGQMMGVWFMCSGLGNVIAGLIAGELTSDDLAGIPDVYLQIVVITVEDSTYTRPYVGSRIRPGMVARVVTGMAHPSEQPLAPGRWRAALVRSIDGLRNTRSV